MGFLDFVHHLEFLTERTSETRYFNSKNSVVGVLSSSSSSSSELTGTPAGGADTLVYNRPYIQNIPH